MVKDTCLDADLLGLTPALIILQATSGRAIRIGILAYDLFEFRVTLTIRLIELSACRDVVVHHQQMQLFFLAALIDRGEEHTAGVDAHHRSRRQVRYCNKRLADELFGLIECVDTAQNSPVCACSVVKCELQELL